MSRRFSYAERADLLIRAIGIAETIVEHSATLSETLRKALLKAYSDWKQRIQFPEPQFRNATSLKYLENDFLSYWNEAGGPDIDAFWSQMLANTMPYERKDVLSAVFKKGKITSNHEYTTITDLFVVAQQEDRISAEDAVELNRMIAIYENKKKLK